jgi:3'(2'), 5'-bisphosphate nucleotidase
MRALCAAALEAGARIMQHYRNGVEAEEKSDKSPVTQADRDAEDLIERTLAALAPDIQMIGEEACSERMPDKLAPHFFLVDPLDGTRDFVAKRKDFTVNIGLISGTAPVAGVIYAPVHEKLYFSGPNSAFMLPMAPEDTLDMAQAKPLRVGPFPDNGLGVLASRSHRDKKTDALIKRLHVRDVIPAASSYKFCLLAEGRADLYPRHGRTMEWDTAAGHAILNAAGGVVTREDGTPLEYGKLERDLDNPSFIAAAHANWQNALRIK